MKQTNILNVLIHIFQMATFTRELLKDDDTLFDELLKAGFNSSDINKTMLWLKTLQSKPGSADTIEPTATHAGVRVFSIEESEHLSTETQDYLYCIEREGIIDSSMREHIINLLISLNSELEIGIVKWVCFMVAGSNQKDEAKLMKLDLLSLDAQQTGVQ